MDPSGKAQVILATHPPILMAYPGAPMLDVNERSLSPTIMEEIGHYGLLQAFARNSRMFVGRVLQANEGARDDLD